jgi:hypothetical protein
MHIKMYSKLPVTITQYKSIYSTIYIMRESITECEQQDIILGVRLSNRCIIMCTSEKILLC